MSAARCVFVTGGTGFVGSALVARLRARGDEVHALVRRPGALAGVTNHLGDVSEADSVGRALASAARAAGSRPLDLVHLAAAISYRRADRTRLERTNVEGTRHVLVAARGAGVRRFLHVSSVAALGPVARAEQVLDDDAPLAPQQPSAYCATKARAEELALQQVPALDLVVASPAVVFGSSAAPSNSQHFLARAVRGQLGPLAPPGSLSVVGLGDTVHGLELVLERGQRGKRYLLCESAWSLAELLALACRLAGVPAPRARAGAGLWRALVAGVTLFDRLRPTERVTPESLFLLGQHFRFEARRARAELGWSPRPIAQEFAEILARLGRGGAT